jgi:hypothetical protein
MSWSLKDRPRTVKVSKALAREWAEMDPAPHDRPLSERRLQVYGKLFKEGLFRPCTWARAFCVETGGTYRVNGKHTSVLLSGLDTLPEFYVTVEDYICDTLEDVARLYATFDSRMQSRTVADINRSFAATVPIIADMPATTINAAVAGMAYGTWFSKMTTIQPAEKAELLLEHTDFIVWLNGLVSASNEQGHLRRQAVTAAMFGTWQKAKLAAAEFWTAVRDESGGRADLPDRRLARFLLTHSINRGRGANRGVASDTREMYVKCLHAWNAWRKNEATDLKYFADKDIPTIR